MHMSSSLDNDLHLFNDGNISSAVDQTGQSCSTQPGLHHWRCSSGMAAFKQLVSIASQLQEAADTHDRGACGMLYMDLMDQLKQLGGSEAAPRATWKKIVQQKVSEYPQL